MALTVGNLQPEDMPPQLDFKDCNVTGLPDLPRSYTHADLIRRLVLRGKYEGDSTARLLIQVSDGQKLYQPAERKDNRCSLIVG